MKESTLNLEDSLKQVYKMNHELKENMIQGNIEQLNQLLSQRFELIKHTVALAASEDMKKTVVDFLIQIFEHDQAIMKLIEVQRELVANALVNMKKVAAYY